MYSIMLRPGGGAPAVDGFQGVGFGAEEDYAA